MRLPPIALVLGLGLIGPAAAAQRMKATPSSALTPYVPPGGPAVTGVRITPSASSIGLRWSCPAGAAGFEVFGGPVGAPEAKLTQSPISANCVQDLDVSGRPIATNPGGATAGPTYSTGFAHQGLPPNADFSYRVRTLYPTGGPADADPVSARTALLPAPPLAVSAGGPGTVGLSWPAAASATGPALGYLVFRKLGTEASFRQVASLGPVGGWTDTGVPAGRHEYRIQPQAGELGAAVPVVTGAPVLWNAGVSDLVTVSLNWNAIWPGGTARVMAASLASGPFQDITVKGGLSIKPSFGGMGGEWWWVADPGTALHFKIVVSYPGLTLESAVKQVPVPVPSPIGAFTAVDLGRDGIQLTWNCEPWTSEYSIKRRVGAGIFEPLRFPGGNPINVFPMTRQGSKTPDCNYVDRDRPAPGSVEYLVVGHLDRKHGLTAINAARTSVVIK